MRRSRPQYQCCSQHTGTLQARRSPSFCPMPGWTGRSVAPAKPQKSGGSLSTSSVGRLSRSVPRESATKSGETIYFFQSFAVAASAARRASRPARLERKQMTTSGNSSDFLRRMSDTTANAHAASPCKLWLLPRHCRRTLHGPLSGASGQ